MYLSQQGFRFLDQGSDVSGTTLNWLICCSWPMFGYVSFDAQTLRCFRILAHLIHQLYTGGPYTWARHILGSSVLVTDSHHNHWVWGHHPHQQCREGSHAAGGGAGRALLRHPPGIHHQLATGVLCCAVLCCAVLCCAMLCCVVRCCAGIHHKLAASYTQPVLSCAVLCCAVLCDVLRCVMCCAV